MIDSAFMSFDYPETRDLLKFFLTICSGTIVLSISFHDKITRAGGDDLRARRLMIWTWTTLFTALVACGVALVLIALAAGCHLYGPAAIPGLACDPWTLALAAWLLIFLAGAAYIAAFAFMIVAARAALLPDRRG